VDVKKLDRIKELKEKRKVLDEEIQALTVELTAAFTAEMYGEKKARKPRVAKQLSLITSKGQP
jgi:hypothetical protein